MLATMTLSGQRNEGGAEAPPSVLRCAAPGGPDRRCPSRPGSVVEYHAALPLSFQPLKDPTVMRPRAIVISLFAALFSPAVLHAQSSALLREGDPLPAAGANHAVSSISGSAVNGVGGYAVSINSSDGSTTLSHVWGNQGPGPGAILFSEGTYGNYVQTSWESFFGIDDLGQVAYSPLSNDTVGGGTGLDGAWLDATPLANEGDPILIPALLGKEFRFNSRPGVTHNGIAYWVAGIDDIATGAGEGNGLFIWNNGVLTSPIKTGDTIPGLSGPLGDSAADFDVRLSGQGTHWILTTDDSGAPTASDIVLIIDGLPVATSAGFIREGTAIPATHGGLPGENWSAFDSLGITESGDYMFTGDTSGNTATDEFVALNGKIIYREGDVVGGAVLTGAIESAYMNEACDIAYVWDVVGVSAAEEALFLNGTLIAREGDAVDLDGDGTVEPTSILRDFTGIAAVSVGANRVVYFTADIDVNGTTSTSDDIEGLFRAADPCGGTVQRVGVGCPGTGGFTPEITLNGCIQAGGAVTFGLADGLGGALAGLLLGTGKGDAQLGFSDCFINISGVSPLILFVPLGGAGAGGGTIVVSTNLPPATAGLTFGLQAAVSDPAASPGFTVSNGLVVKVQ